jgi:dCTP deaminase
MILPGQMIRMRGVFSPFCERSVGHGMSYGLSCAGYDIRLKRDVTLVQGYTILAPALDHIDMPPDLLGMVADKSTWARQGVQVQHTVIEPGWRGTLALELTYQPVLSEGDTQVFSLTPKIMKIEARTPIAQVVVHQLMAPTERPYRGKYMNQTEDDIRAKLENVRPPAEECSERKIYGEEVIPINRDVAGELKRKGLWTEWDEGRQTWLCRVKDK